MERFYFYFNILLLEKNQTLNTINSYWACLKKNTHEERYFLSQLFFPYSNPNEFNLVNGVSQG